MLFLCLIRICFGGLAEFKDDIWLEWSFGDKEDVYFSLYVPSEDSQSWGWVGVGFNQFWENKSMAKGDFVTVILETGEIQDRYADYNEYPPKDVLISGKHSIQTLSDSGELADNYYVYKWKRSTDTEDYKDTKLYKNGKVYLLWARGQTIEGDIMFHNSFGAMKVVLSEDFQGSFGGSKR